MTPDAPGSHHRGAPDDRRPPVRRRFDPADERGDVPGWVLVTIMTAGLVAVLWAFAEPYLTQMLQAALDAVTG